MLTLDVWICVDDAGDYAVGEDGDIAVERYEESVQALTDTSGYRLVNLKVSLNAPEVVECPVQVDDLDDSVHTKVAEDK